MVKKMLGKIPGAKRTAQALGLVPRLPDRRMFLLEALPKESVGAEIGVHFGDFSQQMLDVVVPKMLHLIDPWQHETSSVYKNAWYGGRAKGGQREMDKRWSNVCKRFDREIAEGRVKVERGYSTEVLGTMPDEYLDWVYIDGNHLYEYVKADLALSYQKTKVGGYITGDDYIEGGWWAGGVKEAVDEFDETPTVELIELRNGQYIFRRVS